MRIVLTFLFQCYGILNLVGQYDHYQTFPDLIDGQLGGPYPSHVKWFDIQENPVFTHFLFEETEQIQAEYYNRCDLGYAFRSFWRNGKIQNEGFLKLGNLYQRTDTIPWFDPDTYEETLKVVNSKVRPLIKEGIWWEYDSTGNFVCGQYVDGLREGKWRFLDSRNIERNVAYFQSDSLLKDSSTNILTTQDTNAIKSILIGNWIVDSRFHKFVRTEEDYSNARMPYEVKAFFKFQSDGEFTQNIYVGCKPLNGGMASGVQEIYFGTYCFVKPDVLQLTTRKESRKIKLHFLSKVNLTWSEGLK